MSETSYAPLAPQWGGPWAIAPERAKTALTLLSATVEAGMSDQAMQIDAASRPRSRVDAGAVAVIPLQGVMAQRWGPIGEMLGGASSDAVGRAVTEAAADDRIGAIVLHVNSPGGSVYGLPELAQRVRQAREVKPVVAQADSLAASAAYWVASQASEIVASPGADVGSIGVLMLREDASGALEKAGVDPSIVYAGRYKTEGNPFEPLGDEARAHLQARVDAAYTDFLAAVAVGRGVTQGQVEARFGQGRMVRDVDAKEAGMVDRIATFDETLARLGAGRASGGRGRQAERLMMRLRLERS